MMATGISSFVQNLWPFGMSRNDDLRLSDRLVRPLEIPDETKQFVFAIQDPESETVIYILCAQNLSERSAIDAERLVRCVKPEAVMAQVDVIKVEEVKSLNHGGEHGIPTSSLEVVKRCFLDNISTITYENMAAKLVLKEIFGVANNGHFSAAKRVADEIGASFLLLGSPFAQSENENNPSSEVEPGNTFLMPQKMSNAVPSGSSKNLIKDNYTGSQILNSVPSHLIQTNSDQNITPVNIHPKDDYEPPEYATLLYFLLLDLRNIFLEIPSVGRALAYAQNMLHDIRNGDTIDPRHISEVHLFRIAVEALRILHNDAGRMPISKTVNHQEPKTEFSTLPFEDKSHAFLAHALRIQSKKFKSIVVILEASELSGLREHWNTVIPSEVKDTIEELSTESSNEEEPTNHDDKKRSLTDKPVVAVGAGATAVIGASSLSKAVVAFRIPTSIKLIMTQTHKLISILIRKFIDPSKVIFPGFFNYGVNTSSSMKAAASADKIKTAVQYAMASAEETSFSASRASFYELMRKRRVRPIGVRPWVTFGCSVATFTALLVFGDGIECAVEAVPAAPSIAYLGRGIEMLHQASKSVEQRESSRIQKSIESLVNRFKSLKQAP